MVEDNMDYNDAELEVSGHSGVRYLRPCLLRVTRAQQYLR